MPTAKKAAAKKKKPTKSAARTAKGARKSVSTKAKKVIHASRPKATLVAAKAPSAAPARAVSRSAGECPEGCRICGSTCMRTGMHEQHRCRDHAGMSI